MTKSYVVDCLTYALESGTLRRWEVWLLSRIRERLVSEAAAYVLAGKYGVKLETIRRNVRGVSWKGEDDE